MYARALNSLIFVAIASILFGFASVANAQVCTCSRSTPGTDGLPSGTPEAPACVVRQQTAGGTINAGTCTVAQEGQTIAPEDNALLRDGIFGCSASRYANPGTLAAVGGVYVPVNDAAVTINTGYLVYKECMLDGVTQKISEAARTELTGTVTRAINTRRGGQPLYVQNRTRELNEGKTATIVALLQNQDSLGGISEAYRTEVARTAARRYVMSSQQSGRAYASSFPGSAQDHRAFLQDPNAFSWEGLLAMTDPCNNPLGSLNCLETRAQELLSEFELNQRDEWLEGEGFYAVTDNDPNPLARRVLTPSSLVSEGANQVISAGFRCLENTDEIGEVCAPLFSGLTTQLINDSRGLQGITQSTGGAASYVSRMVNEAGPPRSPCG